DPLNPMKPDQMATQLAQFSSVEQLMNISEQLDAMGAANSQIVNALHGSSAMSTLGRDIVALGDQVAIDTDGAAATVRFKAEESGTGTLRLYDDAGALVGERELGTLPAGQSIIELGDMAAGLPAGAYRYEIDIRDADGSA